MTDPGFIPRPPGVELDATTRMMIAHAARLGEGWEEYDEYQQVLTTLAARARCWPTWMRREAIAQLVEAETDGCVIGWAGPYVDRCCGHHYPRELVCLWRPPWGEGGDPMPTSLDALLADQP
jgi:hypothetical protein